MAWMVAFFSSFLRFPDRISILFRKFAIYKRIETVFDVVIYSVLGAFYFIVVLSQMLVVILENRQPVKTVAWLMVLFFLPVVGLVIYFFFGRNRKREHFVSKACASQLARRSAVRFYQGGFPDLPADYRPLIKLFRRQSGAFPYSDNKLRIFTCGEEMLDNLLRDIARAQHHIHVEFYIIEDDCVGRMVRDALMAKVREGVSVRLIYDDVGCWNVKNRFFREMEKEGMARRIEESGGKRTSFAFTSKDGRSHSAVLVPIPEYNLCTLVVSTGRFGIEEFAFVDRTVYMLFVLSTGLLGLLCVMLCLFYRYCRRLAFVDPVTRGMSPVRFELEYDRKMAFAGREDASLYCIDINRFKLINDFFGHEEGNRLLSLLYANMKRELPGEATCLCRASRDKFMLLVCGIGQDLILSLLDRAMQASIREFGSREGTGRNSSFSVSVGICPITEEVSDLAVVKDHADLARERASMSFGNFIHYGFFDEEDMQRARRWHSIESCMTQSLEEGDFYILLQPKVVLSTGIICGAEALVRWHHPQLGLIMPDEFIPLFERNGFVKRIDMWVFKRVCAMMAGWIAKGYRLLPVSVNLSRCDLENRLSLAEELAKIADAYGVPHEYLDLEITETSFYKDPASIRRVVDGVRKASFQCSIDDFGTGYSSLNLLPDLSVATIKIDRSFLSSGDMEKSSEVIRMVVELADRLGMKVIAEGVETEEQREFLRSCSCQVGQGFLYSKPVSEEEFERMAFGSEGTQAQDKSAKES